MAKFDPLYLGFAIANSLESHDKRSKVGAVFVKDDRVLTNGWNGTPPGDDNDCQDEQGNTKPNVIHAEMNGILKAARDGQSLKDSTLYCTHSPCLPCANALRSVGIARLVYVTDYRDSSGLDKLKESGVEIEKVNL